MPYNIQYNDNHQDSLAGSLWAKSTNPLIDLIKIVLLPDTRYSANLTSEFKST